MSETSIELMPQLPVLSSSQPDSEKEHQPPALFQLPLTAQDPQQQSQLQSELQQQELSETNLEQQAESECTNQKRLLLLLLGLSFSIAIFGLIFYIHHIFYVERRTVRPCLSQACQRAAARLSTSTDLCDHFLTKCGSDGFLLTSGGRNRGQGIPGHPQNHMEKSMWTRRPKEEKEVRGLKEERLQSRKTLLLEYLKGMLETNVSLYSSAVKKTMDFYQSCLDTSSIETAGEEPFLTLIQKLGGWPVSGIWNKTDFNSTLALLMRDYATFPFFSLYVGKGPNETTSGTTKRRYIQIDQPDLLIPIEWNSKTEKSGAKTETLRPFLALCQKYLALLGSPQTTSKIHVYMFISLSSELAVAASPLQYRLLKGQLHQHISIEELQRQAPAIDWLGCLQAVFHPLSLSKDDHVLLHNLPYIIHMSQIITKWQNKHELSNSGPLHTYMLLNLLHTLMPAMDSRFSETTKTFSEALGYDDKETPRWKHCVLAAERGFDSVLTHLLKNVTAHKEAEKMIEDVFFYFKIKLHQLSQTDQNYYQLLTEKVNSLIPRLWTPNRTSGENELDLLFSQVNISSHNFFSNYVQLLSLWQKRRSKLLISSSEPVDVLSLTPFLVGNEVFFPMGMFITPLFHPTYPRAYNYGAAGFLIAKDIFHLLLSEIPFHNNTVQALAECVWAHYLRTTENAGRSGVTTLSPAQQQELWVQYSALEVALKAYHQSLIRRSDDTSILGLSHSHLFLTSFSLVNCDSDPYQEFMPLDPSFLITVICARSNLWKQFKDIQSLELMEEAGKSTKNPTGRGLGKAGARRLGHLLKRATQKPEDLTRKRKESLPKTPLRLFKHRIQKETQNAIKNDYTKLDLPEVSKLIHGVVSQCKHGGRISMAQVKQTLAAEGYDVQKNKRQVKAATKRLVNNEAFVRTTRSASLRLHKKILTEKGRVKTDPVKSKPKEEKMTLRSRGKSHKPKVKNHLEESGLHNQKGKALKPDAREKKQATMLRKTAVREQRPAKIKAAQAKKTQKKGKLKRRQICHQL